MSDVQSGAATGESAMPRRDLFGISAALATPFNHDLSIDLGRLTAHATALLSEGCTGVTLFGTTGEGVALSMRERAETQAAMLAAGVAPERIVVGIASPSAETAVEQATMALDAGIRTLLVPPPFYFKGVGDAGVSAWYASFLDRIAAQGPRVILYHIPQVTGVALSLSVVRELKQAYDGLVFAVKDSAGHWPTTSGFLAEKNLSILVGDERHLAAAVRLGGAGAISGMANLCPALLTELVLAGKENPALNNLVDAICAFPVIPAIKALVAVKRGQAGWATVRPPLEEVPAADVEKLVRFMDRLGQKRAA